MSHVKCRCPYGLHHAASGSSNLSLRHRRVTGVDVCSERSLGTCKGRSQSQASLLLELTEHKCPASEGSW